jgi:hypothetical protein
MNLHYSNIQKINSLGYSEKANCWGSTQFALGVISSPIWQNDTVMARFLNKHTISLTKSQLKKGDILAIFDSHGGLTHTAIYIAPNKYWHKPGSYPAETVKYKDIINQYLGMEGTVLFRRFSQTSWDNDKISKNTLESLIYKDFLAKL